MKLDSNLVKENELILESYHYGKIAYDKSELIKFEKGLLGFEDLKKFIIREIEENKSFRLLHSVEDSKIAFVVINPFEFKDSYEIDIEEEVIERLNIQNESDVMLFNTVTLHNDPSKITTNLRAPIVINVLNKKAEQVILKTEEFKIKHSLMEA